MEGTLTKHHDSRNVEGFKQCSSPPNHANTAATSRSRHRGRSAKVDRRPRTRRIIGVCPECKREIQAAKGESLLLCKCGNPINVQQLREQSRDKAEAIHLTKTPAGMSQWLKDNYGYEVSRKQISNWLNRGKLPSSKPVDDGYWEFNIREILALAMGSSGRPA